MQFTVDAMNRPDDPLAGHLPERDRRALRKAAEIETVVVDRQDVAGPGKPQLSIMTLGCEVYDHQLHFPIAMQSQPTLSPDANAAPLIRPTRIETTDVVTVTPCGPGYC